MLRAPTPSYDLLGRVTQRVEPGLTSTWVYDTAPMGIGKIANFAYTYDALSNLTSRSDTTQALTETFQYDALNRIIQYAITGGATKTVAYDDLGNITSKSDVGTYSYPAAGSAGPHAVSAITPSGTGTVNTTYAYDANGNMLSGNGRTAATWTSFNMVATIGQGTKTVAFDYDGEHSRIRQVTGTGTTLYLNDPGSGLKLEKVTGASGAISGAVTVSRVERVFRFLQAFSGDPEELPEMTWEPPPSRTVVEEPLNPPSKANPK